MTCVACIEIKSQRNPPEEPPCASCRVDLDPDNNDIIKVFMINRNQHIFSGMGVPIDINNTAIIGTMEALGVKDKCRCLQMVRWLYHETKGQQ